MYNASILDYFDFNLLNLYYVFYAVKTWSVAFDPKGEHVATGSQSGAFKHFDS